MSYLNDLHPEIYQTPPRAGGLAKIVPSPKSIKESRPSTISGKSSKSARSSIMGKSVSTVGKSSLRSYTGRSSVAGRSSIKSGSIFDSSILTATPDKASREYRINTVLHTSQWILPEAEEEPQEGFPIPSADPVHNARMILAIVISNIMLMAAGYKDINKDHMRWTLSYLQCVKDEFGNTPPNVRGILNNLRLIDDSLESFLEKEVTEGGMLDASTDPDTEGEKKETPKPTGTDKPKEADKPTEPAEPEAAAES